MDYLIEEFLLASPIKKICILLWGIIFVSGMLFSLFFLASHGFTETFQSIVGTQDLWLIALVFFLLFVIRTAFYIPVAFLLIASPFLFGGFWNGVLMAGVGEIIGATIGFLASRYYLHDFFQRYKTHSKNLEILNEKMNDFGEIVVIISRIGPVSFDVINVGAGLSTMSFLAYFRATLISVWPKCFLFVSIGSAIETPLTSFYTIGSILILVGIVYYLKSHEKYKEIFDMRLRREQ